MSEQQYPATAARQYPRAYFAAPIYLAAPVVTLSGGTLGVAIERYTGLYRELIGRPPEADKLDPHWSALIGGLAPLPDPEAAIDLIYDTYCAQPHSAYDPHRNTERAHIFGALGYVYDETAQARLHFFPQRGAVSALSSAQFPQRRAEFKQLLLDLKARHPAATQIKSSTWLQNLPSYRNLFPRSFTAQLRDVGGGSYLGVWGQFVSGDGSANLPWLAQFTARLATARTLTAALAAFPRHVLEGVGPLDAFYDEYHL